MINIAICDDNIEFCNKLEIYIYELYPNINNLSIDVFYDCSSIIRNLETQKYDIILLDIKFSGNISGIDVGDYIRNNICDDYTQIVYISANERYAYELFDTRPLNFLVKPVDKNKLHDVLDKAMELCNKNINVIVFKNSKEQVRLLIKDIIYIAKSLRKLKVVTRDNEYEFYGKLTDIESKVGKDNFIKIHSSILVNSMYVKSYRSGSIELTNNVILPVSRPYQKNIKKILSDWEGKL